MVKIFGIEVQVPNNIEANIEKMNTMLEFMVFKLR